MAPFRPQKAWFSSPPGWCFLSFAYLPHAPLPKGGFLKKFSRASREVFPLECLHASSCAGPEHFCGVMFNRRVVASRWSVQLMRPVRGQPSSSVVSEGGTAGPLPPIAVQPVSHPTGKGHPFVLLKPRNALFLGFYPKLIGKPGLEFFGKNSFKQFLGAHRI